MRKLTKEQIIVLHELVIKYSGGSGGVRDMSLLKSALEAPYITFDGVANYPTVQGKAARLIWTDKKPSIC
jgi:death-on-curing protein